MRFVPNKRPMPRSFYGFPWTRGLVSEADIFVHPRGRLAAKLLVFNGPPALQQFWNKGLGHRAGLIGRDCRGVVNALATERETIGADGTVEDRRLTGDPRYFCLIGLCAGWLSAEVVAHEATHAGYCYEKRVRRNLFGKAAWDFDEERIAYPVGRIADGITYFLHKRKLYDLKPVYPPRRRKRH